MSLNSDKKSKKTKYGTNDNNKLRMNDLGNMRPESPARTFNMRRDLITAPATNMNSAPLFYVGPRVNVLWSSTSPASPLALGVMRFGNNNYSLHDVFGNNKNVKGQLLPNRVPKLNLTVDYKGNYKLVDLAGKSHRIYSDTYGNYIRHNNKPFYL